MKLKTIFLDKESNEASPTRIKYTLQAPGAIVKDTDIRGFLDGQTQYNFNQGTAYHMRVGRRYGGPLRGEYELKRSLIRWTLPTLMKMGEIRVLSTKAIFGIEGYGSDAPSENKQLQFPLHLYAYPINSKWGPGKGGLEKDSFSQAAPGEASWNEARAGQMAWPAPGALSVNSRVPQKLRNPVDFEAVIENQPLSIGEILGGNRKVILEGKALDGYLAHCLRTGRTFDLLLKLGNQEEDRWGTETGILTSEFGDDKDINSKRPKLEFEVELLQPNTSFEKEVIIETGMEYVLPSQKHPGEKILLWGELTSDDEGVPPTIWIRGGTGEPSEKNWYRLDQPVVHNWDWSQWKISGAPNRVSLGEELAISLVEFWVKPGPRETQVPEATFLAPSGKIHIIKGKAGPDLTYHISFKPDEVGLWKYGWSFKPYPSVNPESHKGESLFFVEMSEYSEEQQLKIQASDLLSTIKKMGAYETTTQWKMNSFIRLVGAYAQRGHMEKAIAQQITCSVREALYFAGWSPKAQMLSKIKSYFLDQKKRICVPKLKVAQNSVYRNSEIYP